MEVQNIIELKNYIDQIRLYINEYRKNKSVNTIDYFFLSMLEVSASLTELAIERKRAITKEEEKNWFKGSYHLDFWDSEINTKCYIPLIRHVEKNNFFRS